MSQNQELVTRCCICNGEKRVWTCDQCNNDAFCDECWAKERPHRQGAKGRGGVPHEKTDQEVVAFLQNILETPRTTDEQLLLHQNDTDTIWFGVERDSTNIPSFQDYGRYVTLMADSIGDHKGPRYPQLVSFIGQTGAGKSTLIKILIDYQERKHHSKVNIGDDVRFASPVTGSVDDNIPTSGDVHLYADPGTYLSETPMLYADCEGLDGGDNLPRGASLEIVSKIKKGASVVQRTIDWAIDVETRRRGFAVSELYPRLLYTFSDTVVFVLRNSKTFESLVLEKLLKWAEASISKSINQPALPHAIIVLNATDNSVDPAQWNSEEATKKLMDDIAGAVDRVPYVQNLAHRWKTQQRRPIKNTQDLLSCYYSSVTVVRIPTVGRWMLIYDQIGQLHNQIQRRCNESRLRKEEVRMSLTSESLDAFLQSAFDHFSKNLSTPFDFMKESVKNNPIPQDFRGNVLKLAIAIKDCNNFPNREDGPRIFEHLSYLVASCIMLDYVRHDSLGTGEQLFEQRYSKLCEDVLREFCAKHWPCSYEHPKYGRCCVVKNVHNLKGHQSASGRLLGDGEYRSAFWFDSYKEKWKSLLRQNVKESEDLRQATASIDQISPISAASQVHKKLINDFFQRLGGAAKFSSNSTCFCCLRELPEHPLPCGHVLCSPCVRAYGTEVNGSLIRMNACPLHEHEGGTRQNAQVEIKFKPENAGVRVLCLDGGGVRGIVELEMLKAIETMMGGKLRIQNFFDIIVGTSTGGIIALGIGAEDWSVDKCIDTFTRVSSSAFTPRPLHALYKGKYKTKPFQKALQEAYTDRYLFGGKHDGHQKDVKVAITTTTQTDRQAVILTNYNRLETRVDPGYKFERADHPAAEWKIWEVARATSAAPFFYKIFTRDSRRFADGGLYYNCPVRVAYQEQKLIWSDTSTQHPDILLSLGSGYSNEAVSPSNSSGIKNFMSRRNIGSFVSLCKQRISNSLNCKLEWNKFWNEVVGNDASPDIQSRYIRLDPLFGFKQPGLDDVQQLGLLRTFTSSLMRKKPYKQLIQDIALRLIASSFFFQASQTQTKSNDEEYEFQGFIRCRFNNNTPELRELGKYLLEKQTDTFQPCLYVEAEGLGPILYQEQLSQTIITDMIQRGKFSMRPVTVKTSRKFSLIKICLCLEEDTSQYPPIPISGFPRNFLAEEDLKKRRPRSSIQFSSGESIPRLEKQRAYWSQSHLEGSSSTLKSDSSYEDLEKRRSSPGSSNLEAQMQTTSLALKEE